MSQLLELDTITVEETVGVVVVDIREDIMSTTNATIFSRDFAVSSMGAVDLAGCGAAVRMWGRLRRSACCSCERQHVAAGFDAESCQQWQAMSEKMLAFFRFSVYR